MPDARKRLTLVAYLLGRATRVREGPAAIAGNHVGDVVTSASAIAECGNSGNSTQPHEHLQATDSTEWERARGLPIAFTGAHGPALPQESEIVSA